MDNSPPLFALPLQKGVLRRLSPTLYFFFISSMLWLLMGSLLGSWAFIQASFPSWVSHLSFLQYGRVFIMHSHMLVYGFGASMAFGLLIALMALLSRVERCPSPGMLLASGMLWQLSVSLGLIGILAGYGAGMPWIDFPPFIWPLLLLSALGIILYALRIFILQKNQAGVLQWYLLGAIMWFVWIFSTTHIALHVLDLPPLMGSVINGWFSQSFFVLFFLPIAIAGLFTVSITLQARPVANLTYLIVGFWVLACIGPWSGTQYVLGAPLPLFVQYVGGGASVGMGVSIVLWLLGLRKLLLVRREGNPPYRLSIQWLSGGMFFLFILGVGSVILSLPYVEIFARFSLSGYGYNVLLVCGVLGFGGMGFFTRLLPSIMDNAAGRKGFWLMLYSLILIIFFTMLLSPVYQGGAQQDYLLSWGTVLKASIPLAQGISVAWFTFGIGILFCLFSFCKDMYHHFSSAFDA